MSDDSVAVCLITHNHAQFIRMAIDGIIRQKVNFPLQVIIADDFSTDGTREIVLSYQKEHPHLIQLILQDKNVGPAQNFIDLITRPASKYIAYLEGDDFWTDPGKLQKQFDYLQTHPAIYGCFHDVVVVDENSKVVKDNYYHPHKDVFNQEDSLIYGGAYCTGSLMFRSDALKNLPAWFLKSPSDYAIDLLLTEFGSIAHINENMGAYRIHQGGTWQGNAAHKNWEKVIVRYKVCLENPVFMNKYGPFFYQRIAALCSTLAQHYQNEKQYFKKLKYSWYYFFYSRPKTKAVVNYLVGTLLFPTVSNKIKLLFSKPAKNDKA